MAKNKCKEYSIGVSNNKNGMADKWMLLHPGDVNDMQDKCNLYVVPSAMRLRYEGKMWMSSCRLPSRIRGRVNKQGL